MFIGYYGSGDVSIDDTRTPRHYLFALFFEFAGQAYGSGTPFFYYICNVGGSDVFFLYIEFFVEFIYFILKFFELSATYSSANERFFSSSASQLLNSLFSSRRIFRVL